eukprot:GHVS01037280.1.p1 GENE.GHVS01037280.1~~GHVS01037280.1.p1  ORF type:complete len:310 (+),score=67.89 GHVS01037280.1:132-1061(+)
MASIAQIRSFLALRGVNVRAILEKPEMLQEYHNCFTNTNKNNNNSNNSNSNNSNSNNSNGACPVHVFERQIAGLDCIVKTNSTSPDVAVCVFHGFGANKEDLADICDNMLRSSPAVHGVGLVVVIPDGHIKLSDHSFGWWPVNVGRLAQFIAQGKVKEIVDDVPPELHSARSSAAKLVKDVQSVFSLSSSQLAFWGFSQGAMLSLDLFMHQTPPPLHLALLSCGPMCQSTWTAHLTNDKAAAQRKAVKIYQTHGTSDMVIPAMGGQLVQQFLTDNGFSVDYKSFSGGHTLPPDMSRIESALMTAATSVV